jgi:hypothetical protein
LAGRFYRPLALVDEKTALEDILCGRGLDRLSRMLRLRQSPLEIEDIRAAIAA